MIPQFQHEATTSFALWLDHHLTYRAEAFSNKEGHLYYTPDERLPMYPEDPNGFVSYNSEYKQWVYDSDAQGAEIPEGVYIDLGDGEYKFYERGQCGLIIDFENGRILLEGAYFPDNYDKLSIKASFSVKDINIYLTDDTEENLVIQNKYNVNSRTVPNYGQGVGLQPYQQVAPAAFVSMERTNNTPFAFGGRRFNSSLLQSGIFAENLYQLDGAMSVCSDTFNMGILNAGYEMHPLDEYGDLKEGFFSYSKMVSDLQSCEKITPIMFIDEVKASKISDRLSKTTNPDLYLGFVDFEVNQARFPRSKGPGPIYSMKPPANNPSPEPNPDEPDPTPTGIVPTGDAPSDPTPTGIVPTGDTPSDPEPTPEPEPTGTTPPVDEKNTILINGGVDNSISVVNGIYHINENSSEDNNFGLNTGVHYFNDIPEDNPIAFYSDSNDVDIRYAGTKWAGKKQSILQSDTHYFWGDVVLEIAEPFSSISYESFNNDYMGGQSNIVYKSEALPHDDSYWNMDFDKSQYTDNQLGANELQDLDDTVEYVNSFVIGNLNRIKKYELFLVNGSEMGKTAASGGVLASAAWLGDSASSIINGDILTPTKGQVYIDHIDAPNLASFEPRTGKSGLFFICLHEIIHTLGIASSSYNFSFNGSVLNNFIRITLEEGAQYIGYNGVQAYNYLTNLNVDKAPMHTIEELYTSDHSQIGSKFTITSSPVTASQINAGFIIHNNQWQDGDDFNVPIPAGTTEGQTFDYDIYIYGQGHTAEFEPDSPVFINSQKQIVLKDSLISPLISQPYFGDFDELILGMLSDIGWFVDYRKTIT